MVTNLCAIRIKMSPVSFLVIGNELQNQMSLDGKGVNPEGVVSSFKIPVVIVP